LPKAEGDANWLRGCNATSWLAPSAAPQHSRAWASPGVTHRTSLAADSGNGLNPGSPKIGIRHPTKVCRSARLAGEGSPRRARLPTGAGHVTEGHTLTGGQSDGGVSDRVQLGWGRVINPQLFLRPSAPNRLPNGNAIMPLPTAARRCAALPKFRKLKQCLPRSGALGRMCSLQRPK
jgi:hypothetical protein